MNPSHCLSHPPITFGVDLFEHFVVRQKVKSDGHRKVLELFLFSATRQLKGSAGRSVVERPCEKETEETPKDLSGYASRPKGWFLYEYE